MAYRLNAQYIAAQPGSYQNPTQVLREESADGYRRRGSTRRRKGLFDGAIADYNEVLRREPDNLEVHQLKALTCHLKGDFRGAEKAYLAAASLFRAQGQVESADNIQAMLDAGLQPLPTQRRTTQHG